METIEKLSKAIQVETISHRVHEAKPNVFDAYIDLLETLFPGVHETCEKTVVNGYALVYHWSGKTKKKPIVLTAHYDVVPIEETTKDQWVHGPFSGAIADGYVWGRGTLDTKVTMIAALDAVESLIQSNYVPDRDIYLAFGHDEEVSGHEGAGYIVKYFQDKGIQFDYLIDEGGTVTMDAVGEVARPVAVIGIAEKGYADVKLTITTQAGHSSTPPKETSVGLMAQVISNLEKNQMPMSLVATKGFFKTIAPEMKGINKVIVSNLWLFAPLFKAIFSKTKNGNALLRTTTAPTMITGSMEPNVMPEVVTAVVNFRIASHETIGDVVEHIKAVNKGLPLEVEVLGGNEPSQISDAEGPGFLLMKQAIHQVFGDVVVAPYLTLARTDAIKYEPVADNMYRFAPYMVDNQALGTIHGVNERISIDNVHRAKAFYDYIIQNC